MLDINGLTSTLQLPTWWTPAFAGVSILKKGRSASFEIVGNATILEPTKGLVMNKQGYVYILASSYNGTLYVGATSDLVKRIYQHKEGCVEGFSKKHGAKTLVYYEIADDFQEAFLREKQIKAWKREWKIRLIEKDNPKWEDLYGSLF